MWQRAGHFSQLAQEIHPIPAAPQSFVRTSPNFTKKCDHATVNKFNFPLVKITDPSDKFHTHLTGKVVPLWHHWSKLYLDIITGIPTSGRQLNFEYLRQAFRNEMVISLPDVAVSKSPCGSCIKGKLRMEPFPKKASKRAIKVHMDLCGPMQHASLGGSEYFELNVDDFSRLTLVFFLGRMGL